MSADNERSKTESERQHKINLSTKLAAVERNPCLKEQEMSYKCLDDNGYDRDKCSKYFQNYKNCKEFWHHIVLDRKRKGIKPALPPVSDREQVKGEYKFAMPWL